MNTVLYKEETLSEGANPTHSVYSVVSEELWHPDFGKYHTYGIEVLSFGCACVLHDVSTDESKVSGLVDLMNRHRLSPIHLYDFVLDSLS